MAAMSSSWSLPEPSNANILTHEPDQFAAIVPDEELCLHFLWRASKPGAADGLEVAGQRRLVESANHIRLADLIRNEKKSSDWLSLCG
jgi:hypothetical protein